MAMLDITNLSEKVIDEKVLQLIFADFLIDKEIKQAEVSLVFISDSYFKSLNKKYRGEDKVSDVLSFSSPDFQNNGDYFLGEIFINLEEITRSSKYQEMLEEISLKTSDFDSDKSLEKYLLHFIFVHGLLHLIGLNDELENERKEMISLGKKFLDSFYKKRKFNMLNLS